MSSMPLIQLNNVSKVYEKQGGAVSALKRISLTINTGEFVAILGPSGSGKSTLLNLLGTLDFPDVGDYFFNGTKLSGQSDVEISRFRAQNIGFVFQSYNLLPHLRAWENVMLPARYLPGKKETPKTKTRALELLEMVGLGKRTEHLPSELSGGEEQRVAIARALINDPPLILADEPTGNLDSKSQVAIMNLLKMLHEQGKTLLVVSHNPEIAAMAGRVVRLMDGCLSE